LNSVGFNPIELDQRISNLSIERYTVEAALREIEKKSRVEIVDDFYVFSKPVKPKKAFVISLSGITGLFIGLFMAFFVDYLIKRGDKKVW